MSSMPLETCWAFNKFWNNKFCYKVASCWLFLLIQNVRFCVHLASSCEEPVLASSCPSLCLSACLEQGSSYRTDFCEISYMWLLVKFINTFRDTSSRRFTWRFWYINNISPLLVLFNWCKLCSLWFTRPKHSWRFKHNSPAW